MSGSALTFGSSFLLPTDPGLVIMIMGAGPGAGPLWTTINVVSSGTAGTTIDSATAAVTDAQCTIFRQLPSTSHILCESLSGQASIRNFPTFNFDVVSIDGSFIPVAGTPILVIHSIYGDQFGGYIEQAKSKNMLPTMAVTTSCECVAWDKVLTRRLIYLTSNNNPVDIATATNSFVVDGKRTSYDLFAVPITVTAVDLVGSCSISGNTLSLIYGAQFYSTPSFIGTQVILHYTSGDVTVNITAFPNTNTATLASSPGNTSGVLYSIPQTFGTVGSNTSSQWFWSPTTSTIQQGFASTTARSETLQPYGGTFDMLAVTYTYLSQIVYSNIAVATLIESIIGLISNEGITTSISLASDVPTITQINFQKSDTIDSALAAIVKQINDGVNNYWYRMSPRKVLVFDIIGVTQAAPWNIEVGGTGANSDGNVAPDIDLEITLEKYSNTALVEVSAAQGSSELSQNIVGGSPQRRSWNVSSGIAATPTITRWTQASLAGIGIGSFLPYPQTVGLLNDPATGQGMDWYWSPGSPTITQDPVIGFALGFGTGGDTVGEYLQVQYFPQISLVQTYQDTAGIAARIAIEGGSGEYDTYVSPGNLANIADSANVNYAQAVIAAYGSISKTLNVVTPRGGLAPAMSMVITLTEFGLSATMVVDSVGIHEEQNITKWRIALVFGAVIGDWKTAWKSMGGGETGISGIGNPGTNNNQSNLPSVWSPNYETPVSGDPILSASSFGVSLSYTFDQAGNALPTLGIYGTLPPLQPNASVQISVRREFVSGVFNQIAASISSGLIALGGSSPGSSSVGRIISKTGNLYGSTATIPIQDFKITFDDGDGNFSVTPDPLAAGCQAGDTFSMRMTAVSSTPNSITDPVLINPYNPNGLALPTAPVNNTGNYLLCIGGTQVGCDPQTVVSNTNDTIIYSPGLDGGLLFDNTSVLVLVEAIPQVTLPLTNPGSGANQFLGNIPIPNYAGDVVRVEGYIIDVTGVIGLLQFTNTVPFREVFVWGAQGVVENTALTYTVNKPDLMIRSSSGTGNIVITMLPFSQTPNRSFEFVKATSDANTVTINTAGGGDVFPGGGTSIVLTDATTNYYSQVKTPSGTQTAVIVSGVGATGGSGGGSTGGAVTAVVGSDDVALRFADQQRQIHPVVKVLVTCAAYPATVSIWINEGSGQLWQGWFTVTSATVPVLIGAQDSNTLLWPPLTAPGSWTVTAVTGEVNSDAAIPGAAITSASFTVEAVSLPLATDITSLTIPSGAGGSWPYNVIPPDGTQYASIPSVSYNDATAAADPNAYFIRITAQDYGTSHGPTDTGVGPEQAFAGTQVSQTGATYTSGPLLVAYGLTGYNYTRTGPIAYVRFRVYACNEIDQTPNSFMNAACANLQTGIGSGAGYVDIEVAAGGALPAGALDLGRATNFGPTFAISGGALVLLNASITNAFLAAGAVEATNLAAASVGATTLQYNAVTAANGALAANAVVDSNIASVSIGKVIAGTVVFTGAVYMSQGSTGPVIALLDSGVYLYSIAGTGQTGLTNNPYVGITNSIIGVYSGGNPSVTVDASGVFLWSVNGNTSSPYMSMSSFGVDLYNGSVQLSMTAGQMLFTYSGGATLTLTSTQVILANGTVQLVLAAGQGVFTSPTGSVSINAAELSHGIGNVSLVVTGGACFDTVYLHGQTWYWGGSSYGAGKTVTVTLTEGSLIFSDGGLVGGTLA